MKKLYFLFLLLVVCLSTNAQTWTLDSFYRPGAVWTEYEYIVHSGSSTSTYISSNGIQYRIDSIGLINNLNYLFVSKRYHGSLDINTWSYVVTNNPWTNFGRLRIDSNRVYFTRDSGSSICYGCHYKTGVESIVYDYGLNPGDTFHVFNQILVDIDSIKLNTGQYVKRYNFDNGSSWLYGIGGKYFIANHT